MTDKINAPMEESLTSSGQDGIADTSTLSAGTLLRQAREAKGMNIELLASMIKVSVAKLEKLEADDYEALPDVAFTRSLALSICKRLEIDEVAVLAGLPKLNTQKTLDPQFDVSVTMRPTVMKSSFGRSKKSRLWWILLGLFLIILAALFFMPATQWYESWLQREQASNSVSGGEVSVQSVRAGVSDASISEISPVPPHMLSADLTSPAVEGAAVGSDNTAAGSSPGVISSELSTVMPNSGSQTALSIPVTSAEVSTISTQPPTALLAQASVPVAAAGFSDLNFSAEADSWITVRNKNGETLTAKILHAGETLNIPLQNLPLSVTVGNTKVTTVQVRGVSFDMTPYVTGNVARFEVK